MVRQGAGLPLLLASLTGWFILAAIDQRIPLTEICAASIGLARLWYPPIGGTGQSALVLLVLASFAMVLVMMAPLLTEPMTHLWIRSLARRRLRAVALFALAYAAMWTAAMTLLAVASAGLASAGPLPLPWRRSGTRHRPGKPASTAAIACPGWAPSAGRPIAIAWPTASRPACGASAPAGP
jgi:hypothetical protein